MTDYIRRDYLYEQMNSTGAEFSLCDALEMIENFPAADVAEVVRCKDCKHAERYERIDGTASYYCGHPRNTFTYGERWDRVFKPVKEADEFCSYGERREEP
nr:MAG TPA: hypothetical protein [Caudoviricetes sp.]